MASIKLCLECYKNILAFHEFKSLAQKNDLYWKTLETEIKINKDNIFNEIKEEFTNNNFISMNNDSDVDFTELSVKVEDIQDCESDDELLSVIKLIKDESVSEDNKESEDTKENEPVKIKKEYKKRGRAKKSHKPVEMVCEECGKRVRNLKAHMYQHKPLSERRRFKCKVCDKVYSTMSARYKHNRIKHLSLKKRCNVCSKEVVDLWSHCMKMHNPSRMPHACAVCARRFLSPTQLAAHAATHSAARPHQCDQCEKAFGSKIVMLQHRRQVHDKEKSHLCQFCSKSFFKKYHLQVHLRSHSKEKPYECNQCGKFFTSTTTLKNHKLTHNEHKQYECTHCSMKFRTPAYLKIHMAIHAKIKKHPCKYCGVRFGRSDHRKRHERTAHERHLLANTA
ncbi:uncharacterized protein [Epargyreus clarus]